MSEQITRKQITAKFGITENQIKYLTKSYGLVHVGFHNRFKLYTPKSVEMAMKDAGMDIPPNWASNGYQAEWKPPAVRERKPKGMGNSFDVRNGGSFVMQMAQRSGSNVAALETR